MAVAGACTIVATGFAMRGPAFTPDIRLRWLRTAVACATLLAVPAAFGRDFPLPPRGEAIEATPTAPLAGAWIGEARAPERTYRILLFHRAGAPLYDGTEYYRLNCVILEPPGLESSDCGSSSPSGDATTLKASMVGEYGESQKGLFSASSAFGELSLSLGGDERLSGTWHESEASFRRLVPRIEQAVAAPIPIEDLEYHWRHFRENGGNWKNYQFGMLRVVLTGTDLPRAGYGVGEIVVDDPHFELYRAIVADDGRLQVDFRLHEGVRAGTKRVTLAGGATAEFDLVVTRTPCTGISVDATRLRLPFGEDGRINWHLTPEGCAPPPGDRTYVTFGSSDRKVVETLLPSAFDRWSRVPFPPTAEELGGSTSYVARGPGTAELIVSYESLSGTVPIVVDDREPCTALAIAAVPPVIPVGGRARLKIPQLMSGVETRFGGEALLLPAGCTLKEAAKAETSVQPDDVVQLSRSISGAASDLEARGLKPGRATVSVEIGDLKGSIDVHVTPPPPCDGLRVYFDQPIAVGEVTGVAWRGGMHLTYTHGGGGAANSEICARPPGNPYYQASSRHIEIDRATGAVTGISPGDARVAVFHGDLLGVTTITVTETAGEPCTAFYGNQPPLRLALGERSNFLPDYAPHGCNPPSGRPSFTVDPIGPVVVTPDGVIAGQGPGTATVTVRHGGLTATREAIVADLDPCTTIGGVFEPQSISALVPVTLRITYGPLPCARPGGNALLQVNRDHFMPVLETGMVRTIELSDSLKRFAQGAESEGEALLAIRLDHGELRAHLRLPWFVPMSTRCRFGHISLSADRISVGETARIDIETSHRECVPGRHLVSELADGITEIRSSGDHLVVEGIRGGSTWIRGPMNSVELVIESPPCSAITVTYPKVLKRKSRAVPDLAYAPEGCTRPAGWATYTSDAPMTILVEETLPRGTIRARDLDPSNPGIATITAMHGNLRASIAVAVEGD